jgi:uncharacterized protein (DUF2141 family)
MTLRLSQIVRRRGATALLAASIATLGSAAALASGTGRIEAVVSGVSNAPGMVGCALFSSPAGFPLESGRADVKVVRVPAVGGTAACIFNHVPPGDYAIAVVHDTNDNHRADVNFLGIPTEGVGVSNNVMPRMSSPTFEANRFRVEAGHMTKLAITLRY